MKIMRTVTEWLMNIICALYLLMFVISN